MPFRGGVSRSTDTVKHTRERICRTVCATDDIAIALVILLRVCHLKEDIRPVMFDSSPVS